MPDDIQPGAAPAAAPAAEPAAAPAAANPSAATEPGAQPDAPAATDFALPDAYKDKGWAKNIKSIDDVYAKLDNAQEQIGKKHIIPDLEKATPEEREEYYKSTRPADVNAYAFDDNATTPELKAAFGEMLHKNGISKTQGDALIQAYNKLEMQMHEQNFGAAGMEAEFKKSFGDNYQATVGETSKLLRGIASAEDIKLIEGDSVNNKYIGLIHRLAKAVQDKYGVKETSAPTEGNPTAPAQDMDKLRAELREKIAAEDKKPLADPAVKEGLIKQLDATYRTKK